jgi:tetratricopeptide (TPR) repeat protein
VKLAVCLKEAGHTGEAIELFQRTLTLKPECVDVHYQLGLIFAQRNRFDLALEEFEQAVAGNAANLDFRANLALALQNIGMVDKATATWREICELSRDNDSVLMERRRVVTDSGSNA